MNSHVVCYVPQNRQACLIFFHTRLGILLYMLVSSLNNIHVSKISVNCIKNIQRNLELIQIIQV